MIEASEIVQIIQEIQRLNKSSDKPAQVIRRGSKTQDLTRYQAKGRIPPTSRQVEKDNALSLNFIFMREGRV